MSTIVCDRRRRRGGTEGVPLLGQEGWTRHQENAAKPPLKARPGWSVRRKRGRAGLTTPSAPLRLLRVFLLVAQPPLLSQEGTGDWPFFRICEQWCPHWRLQFLHFVTRVVMHTKRDSEFPSWIRRGGCAINKCGEASLAGADGVVDQCC